MPLNSDDIGKYYARVDVYDAKDEAAYQAKRSGLSFVTRNVARFVGNTIEGSADTFSAILTETIGDVLEFVVGPALARNLGALAGSIGGNVAGIASVGLAAGLSAGFVEMDYMHQKRNIRELYRNEIAAQLNKPGEEVSTSDLKDVARSNRTIGEELNRARRQRNFNVPLAIVCTLASFAAVTCLLPAVITALSLPALAGVGGFLVKAAVSMATYYATKAPLQAWGRAQFGLYSETVNDRITDIRRDHAKCREITPEMVLGVFTKANTKLDGIIEQEFGKKFDSMTPQERHAAVEFVDSIVPVRRLAGEITAGKIRATELAFASNDEISGVPRNAYAVSLCDVPEQNIAKQVNANFAERFARSAQPASHTERLAQQSQNNDPTLSV